ncbi:MAG TPA: hypothetical protein VM889_04945 [Candidatus Thermoplasmatota archaeon]|nr:hypothetical protein [Candidatus Thermoplasmatota archaeon]
MILARVASAMKLHDRVLVALALAGIAGLQAIAGLAAPRDVALEDLAAAEGSRVRVTGHVASLRVHARGAVVALVDDARRVDVWLDAPPEPALSRGDRVAAVGLAGRGPDGAPALSARAADLARLEPAESPRSVADVTARARALEGLPVAVRGEATRHLGGWVVHDGAGASLAAAFVRAPEPGPIEAWGTLRYDAKRAAYALEVDRWR